MSLLVRTDTLEKQQEAVEALRGIGVEVINADDENPINDVLFYLSRINSKLDNLGQLKHLYELTSIIRTILSRPSHRESINELMSQETQENFSVTYYNNMGRKHNLWPLDTATHKMSAKYLTKEQIDILFNL